MVIEAFTEKKHYLKSILADQGKLAANALVSYIFHNF